MADSSVSQALVFHPEELIFVGGPSGFTFPAHTRQTVANKTDFDYLLKIGSNDDRLHGPGHLVVPRWGSREIIFEVDFKEESAPTGDFRLFRVRSETRVVDGLSGEQLKTKFDNFPKSQVKSKEFLCSFKMGNVMMESDQA